MKTNLRMLVAAFVASAGALGVQAQTDVTSTYLTNAGFDDSSSWVTSNLSGSDDAKDVVGWTVAYTGFTSSAAMGYGSTGQISGTSAPSAGFDGSTTGGCLGIHVRWGTQATYTQDVTLPAGTYNISYAVYNGTANTASDAAFFGFVEEGGTTHYGTKTSFAANAWTTETISFELTESTTGKISVGVKSQNQGGGSTPKLFVDYIKILAGVDKTDLNAEIATATALKGTDTSDAANTLQAAIDAAQAVADNTSATLSEVQTEVSTLQAAISMYQLINTGDATSYIVNPSFETGSLTPWVATSQSDMGVKQNSGGYIINNADGNYVFNTWSSGTNNYSVKQTLTGLPEGYYTVTALAATDAGNTVSIYAGSEKVDVNPSAKETGTDGTTARVHVTDGTLEIGATSSAWFKVDNFRLNYYTTPDLSELANRWKEAHDAAVAAQSNTDYADVNGVAKATLDTETAKAEPTTADAYEAAITALNDATEAFIAAEKDYKALKAEIATASGLDTDVDAANALLTSTTATAAEVAEGVNTLKVAEYNKVNDTYTADVTDTYISTTWTSDMATVTGGQHWDGTNTAYYEQSGSDWGASSWNRAMSQALTLPAGKYVLKVAGRSSTDAAAFMAVNGDTIQFPNKGDAGYGITLNGATSFSDSENYANSNNGRGWEWRYIPFELAADGTANISLGGTTNTTHQWMSITSITLLAIPDTITLDETVNYTAEAKAAANVVLKRSMTKAGGYYTLCVPFDMDATQVSAVFGEGTELYSLGECSATSIDFASATTISANVPCVVMPTTNATSYEIEGVNIVEPSNNLTATSTDASAAISMVGSYSTQTLGAGNYFMMQDGGIYTVTSTIICKGFHAYFKANSATPAKLLTVTFNGENVTGIGEIDADENIANGDIYTLNGQLVRKNASSLNGLAKGIYIMNGKKIIVK